MTRSRPNAGSFDATEADHPASPRNLLVALSVAALWYVVLVTVAVTTANPVIVNRAQFADSALVVVGTVAADGVVDVEQVVRGVLPSEQLRILVPPDVPPGRYVLPLNRTGNRFEITPARTSADLHRVYPVTEDVLKQFDALKRE